ncbi:hypothetical protein ASF72_18330 [Arthrobacter sp. Leaf141]|nr:hypothetical protein ASF72_18330 [Arthrobacter sp. Leaf141]
MSEVDERVDVVFTDYFNHSYMPDMVLTWQESGKRKERPLFVRTSVDPESIAVDIHGLVSQSPLVIAVDERSSGTPAREAVEIEKRNGRVDLLMTDTSSISTLTPNLADSGIGYDFSRLVGQNFLSGGRGFVGPKEAAAINSAAVVSDTADSYTTFNQAIDQYFMEDAALRLKRSTGLVRDVLRGDFEQLAIAGKFSQAELRTVLPLLLGSLEARNTPKLWADLGQVMQLSDLFDIATDLEKYDVSPLLSANVKNWTAKRSQVVMRFQPETEEAPIVDGDESGENSSDEPLWQLWRGLVALDMKDWRILFADDARKLKGRSANGTTPQWSDLSGALPSFAIKAVDLHGLSRRVSISAERSGDIYGDIASVTDALDETFYVPRLQITENTGAEDCTSLVEFSEMLVTSSPADSLANHAKAAIHLLLHNKHVDTSELGAGLVEILNTSITPSASNDVSGEERRLDTDESENIQVKPRQYPYEEFGL